MTTRKRQRNLSPRTPRAVLVLTLVVALTVPSPVESSGCIFLRDDQSIRCQNASLLDVGESLHILTTVVQNSPQTIDVDDCGGTSELPPIFGGINGTAIDTVRVRRSGLRSLHMDVFVPLADALRDLDLSHNALRVVPEAVAVLWSLEHLNLQHNRIVFLRPSAVFDGVPGLRELNLAHNYVGQAGDLGDEFAERHGYQLKGSLKLEDFSLGRAARSLESLNLRGNRLASVPQQVSGHSLPELRHLDLSENVIGRTEELSAALLPKLEFLDFQSNRIQSLNFYSMPVSLKYLDLTENPFNCDCSALWLYDWYSTNTTNIRLPTCNSPERFKNRELDKVPWLDQCQEDNATYSFRYMAKAGFRDYDVIQLATSSNAVTISWRVQADSPLKNGRKWAVVYRRATDSPHQMTLVTPHRRDQATPETVWTQKIGNLQESTPYIVCVALVQNGKYTIEPSKCRQVTTKSRQDPGSIWSIQGPNNANRGVDEVVSNPEIETTMEDVSVSASAITIKWKLSVLDDSKLKGEHSLRHEWTIRIRRTGSDNYTEIPVYDITSAGEADGQMYEYGISDLASHTHYDVCLMDVEHRPISDRMTAAPVVTQQRSVRSANESTTCTTVQTTSNHILYATEIAAIALACSICFIVSAVTLFLCRQKRLLKWKPKKLKKWFAVGCKERPHATGGCGSRYAATTIPRLRCEPRDRNSEKCIVGTWNTLRMPYKDFPQIDDSEGVSAKGYKDALTCVTIYKSGYSEC